MCTYRTYTWNVVARTAVDNRVVRHPYSSVTEAETHAPTGCTVCQEDQVTIRLPDVPPFQVCRVLAPAIAEAVRAAVANGEPILTITGYRVGVTKGAADAQGNRTEFSLHSFGVALDVNERRNGLYDHCPVFGPSCRLLRGGPWRPGQAGTIAEGSAIVRELVRIGLRWGGQIEGQQKDFMHFSPTGY
jgi:hypothetical protein